MDYVFFGVFGLIGLYMLYSFYNSNKQVIQRKFKKLPAAKIADLKFGQQVKITGKATVLEHSLEAPITGRTCLYYQTKIVENKKNGGTLVNEEQKVNFLLKQGEESIEIDCSNVLCHLVADGKFRSNLFDAPTERISTYLRKKGSDSKNLLGLNRSLKSTEGVLEIDETVTVAGKVDFSAGENENGEKRFRLVGDKKNPLLITDDRDAF